MCPRLTRLPGSRCAIGRRASRRHYPSRRRLIPLAKLDFCPFPETEIASGPVKQGVPGLLKHPPTLGPCKNSYPKFTGHLVYGAFGVFKKGKSRAKGTTSGAPSSQRVCLS